MSDPQKKWKLNRQAKAILMRHTPHTMTKERRPILEDYLKYPKISKEFLFVSNAYKVYSLNLRSFSDEIYTVEIGYSNEPSDTTRYGFVRLTFKELQKLSKWFHVSILNVNFVPGCDQGKTPLDEQIDGFRQIWSTVYPESKINLNCYSMRSHNSIVFLFDELSSRICNLTCRSDALVMSEKQLTLNSCHLSIDIDIDDLKQLMKREHKIRKLDFDLFRGEGSSPYNEKWKQPLFPCDYFDDFPTNSSLKQLEIRFRMDDMREKVFDLTKTEILLSFFPNLTSLQLCLSIKQRGDGEIILLDFDVVKKTTLNTLDFIHELRMMLAQNRPSIELDIIYDFDITGQKGGFEDFDDWAKSIIDHPEFSGIDKIGPAFKYCEKRGHTFKDGKYYMGVEGDYHAISLEWKHTNFTGLFYLFFHEYFGPEGEGGMQYLDSD